MQIKNLTTVVVGSTSGYARATARALLSAGARVAILDCNDQLGSELAEQLGHRAVFIHIDVTDERSVNEALSAAEKEFGRVDVIVNTGYADSSGGSAAARGCPALSRQYKKIIETNLLGAFNILQSAARKMACNRRNAEGESGVIINAACSTASGGSLEQDACRASSEAMGKLGLPLAKAYEFYGIRVNTIESLSRPPVQNRAHGLPEIVPVKERNCSPEHFASTVISVVEDSCVNAKTISVH